MNKVNIFNTVLRIVAEETEISPGRILSGRKDSETVDARYLLVYFLHHIGFTPPYIAEKIGKTERTVTYIQTNFDQRFSTQKMFRIQCENIRKRIRNIPFPS